jgi:EpsI family protein
MSTPRISRRGFLISGAMLSGAGMAVWIRPDQLVADELTPLHVAEVIPKRFGDWQEDARIPVVLPAPDVQAAINRIYAETVARTYVNSTGQQIMLSIAYGRNQSDAVQVHKPEGCYGGQGFGVGPVTVSMIELGGRLVPMRRMIATRFERVEPVSYYTVIGNVVSSTGWREKIVQLKYGLSKRIPDGLLMRVSSIGDSERQFPLQDQFLRDLLAALPAEQRPRFVGRESSA